MTADNHADALRHRQDDGRATRRAWRSPDATRYGMSSWEHNGHQYIIVQLTDGLAAFGLPAAMPQAGDDH